MLSVRNRFTKRYLKIFSEADFESIWFPESEIKMEQKKMYLPTQQVDVCYHQQNRSMLHILKHPKVFTVNWINLRPVVEIINLSKFLVRRKLS